MKMIPICDEDKLREMERSLQTWIGVRLHHTMDNEKRKVLTESAYQDSLQPVRR